MTINKGGDERMDFEKRLEKLISDRGATKHGVANLTGIPYTTFLYKSKMLERWNMIEFGKLVEALRLTPEEQEFLSMRGE